MTRTSVEGAASAAASSSAAISFKPVASFESGALGDGWFLAGMGLLVALAIAVLIRQRKLVWPARARSTGRAIDIVESTRLGERMRLSVIRFHDRELLVAHGEHNATVLADGPIPGLPEDPAA